MKNFCEYYSKLPAEKKCLTILFCPCVMLYYLIYNLLKGLANLLTCIIEKCFFPCLDKISRCISFVIEKICFGLDYVITLILKLLNSVLRFISIILEKIFVIFKPIIDCLVRILNCFCQNFCKCLQKIHSCIEASCIFVTMILESCLNKIYAIFCRPCCNCLKTVLFKIYDWNTKYIIFPIAKVTKRVCSFFYSIFECFYNTFVRPIVEYLLRPIYNCLMNYFILVIYRYVKSIFAFIYAQMRAVFGVIAGIVREIKNVFTNIFYLIIFRGQKPKIINTHIVKDMSSNHKTKAKVPPNEEDVVDLENGKEVIMIDNSFQQDKTGGGEDRVFTMKKDMPFK